MFDKRGSRRCGVVVPNGFLFGDGVSARIKEQLLRNFDLHTIVRLPNGVFAPYTSISTNLLFFARTQPTTEIWFYEHLLSEGQKTYSKTRPMQFEEFAPLIEWWDSVDPSTGLRASNEHAWKVRADDILKYDENKNLLSVDLDIKSPNGKEDLVHLPPHELAEIILAKEKQIAELMDEIKSLLNASK